MKPKLLSVHVISPEDNYLMTLCQRHYDAYDFGGNDDVHVAYHPGDSFHNPCCVCANTKRLTDPAE